MVFQSYHRRHCVSVQVVESFFRLNIERVVDGFYLLLMIRRDQFLPSTPNPYHTPFPLSPELSSLLPPPHPFCPHLIPSAPTSSLLPPPHPFCPHLIPSALTLSLLPPPHPFCPQMPKLPMPQNFPSFSILPLVSYRYPAACKLSTCFDHHSILYRI